MGNVGHCKENKEILTLKRCLVLRELTELLIRLEIQSSLVLAGFIIHTGLDIFAILDIHEGLVILASIIIWTFRLISSFGPVWTFRRIWSFWPV